jgi:8-oxo-dGTP diphosphatase
MTEYDGRPLVIVSPVMFALSDSHLLVYLESDPDTGAAHLPRTSVPLGQPLQEATEAQVQRHLGISNPFVQQLYTFGATPPPDSSVTVAYLVLISGETLRRIGSAVPDHWHPVNQLPAITQNSREIIEYALTRLRYKIEYSAVAFELLPEEFTLRELYDAYRIILNDDSLDKANFRKKIREAGILEEVPRFRETRGRPARLFRFREDAQLETKARRFFP